MNKKPFVNIIILNWNNYLDTSSCLDSLMKIEYKFWGATIIDNNSTDGSCQKLKRKYAKNKKIKFIVNDKNEGFSRGNNIGMKKDLFNSDYFLLLNNDTIVDGEFLTELINQNKDLISPIVYNYFSRKDLSKKDFPGKFNLFFGGGKRIKIEGKNLQKVDYASGSCWLLKKDLFKKTGGFNENFFAYNEEIEWAYRLKERGYEFYLCPNSKIWHKCEGTSKKISGFKIFLTYRNMIWFEMKYANFIQRTIFFMFLFLYKFPKRILLNMIEGDFNNKTKSLISGIKAGITKNEK